MTVNSACCNVAGGSVQVSRGGFPVCFLLPGQCFGEVAVLFRWKHTVSFKAESAVCHVWTIDGHVLEQIFGDSLPTHGYGTGLLNP